MDKLSWMERPDQSLWNRNRKLRVNRVLVNAGRRARKTTHGMFTAVSMAEESPYPGEVWYGGPTFRQAKMIMWTRLNEWLEAQPIKLKHGRPNATDLVIPLIHKRAIRLVGMDSEDSLRGPGPIGFVGDEWAMVKNPASFTNIVEPAMSDKIGPAVFYSTPRGRNHFYRMWKQGQPGKEAVPGWASYTVSTEEAGTVHPSVLDAARREMTPDFFAQEFGAVFHGYTGSMFPEFIFRHIPDGHIMTEKHEAEYVDLRTGWKFNTMDYGFADETHLLYWWVSPNGRVYIYDSFALENCTPENFMARLRGSESPLGGAREPLADIYGDPSMWQTEGTSGQSPAMKFTRAGWNLRPAPRRLFQDRVNALRELLQFPSDNLLPGLVIIEHRDPKLCSQLAMADDTWLKANRQGFRNGLDVHALDALLYGSMIVKPRLSIQILDGDAPPPPNPATHIQDPRFEAVATVGDPTEGTDGY
jgi:hypothetical protein